jgi:hypothetical protein
MLNGRRFERWRMQPVWWALGAVTIAVAAFVVMVGPTKIGQWILQGRQALVADENKSPEAMDEKQIVHAVEGAKSIKQAMKSPDSFKLESMTIMPSGAVCYVYLAKNELGGVVKAAAVLFKDEIATLETQGFDLRWKDECQGKKGRDVTGFGELMVY